MRSVLLITLILFSTAGIALCQDIDTAIQERPLTRREVRRWLTVTQHDAELSAQANQELIELIQRRGVEFALSREEEWAFKLLEATDELLEAIRDGMPDGQRRAILDVSVKKDLYTTFTSNFSRSDLFSRKTAYEAGKEFVERFRNDPSVKDQVNFITRLLPQLERTIKALEQRGRIRTN